MTEDEKYYLMLDEIEKLKSENRKLKETLDSQCVDCAWEIANERDKLKAERDKAVDDLIGVCKSCAKRDICHNRQGTHKY